MKKFGLLIISASISLLICSCAQENEDYQMAKNALKTGEQRHFNNENYIKFLLTLPEIERLEWANTYGMDYSNYEWAVEQFKKLANYKKSKQFLKEAAYKAGEYRQNFQNTTDKVTAFYYFVEADDYQDATHKAMHILKTEILENIQYTESKIFNNNFLLLDDTIKRKYAPIIYQYAENRILTKDWNIIEGNTDIRLLMLIKGYTPISDNIFEKLYNEASLDNIDWPTSIDWYTKYGKKNGEKFLMDLHTRNSITQRTLALQFLGDYKNSKEFYRRCEELTRFPTIDEKTFENNINIKGTPQARTVILVISDDGKDAFSKNEFSDFYHNLKIRAKGNIYFTGNIGDASAAIHYKVDHPFWKSFTYSGNGIAHYYHTNITIELRSKNDNILYRKALSAKYSRPQQQIGGDFNQINIAAHIRIDDIVYSELLENFDKYSTGD